MRGLFITFEGIDGCGKTTQLLRIAEALRARDVDVHETREPGGTPGGARIRSLLLHGEALLPKTELFLFAADRSEHVEKILRPRLSEPTVVLCDRYTDATVAFQGGGRGLDVDLIERLSLLATGGLRPDVTLVFDLEVEEALARVLRRSSQDAGEETRFDRESVHFHARVRESYLELARREPERVRVIDAAGSVELVAGRVHDVVFPLVEAWRSRS